MELGFVSTVKSGSPSSSSTSPRKSVAEVDLQERITKKIKEGIHVNHGAGEVEASYKEMVTGRSVEMQNEVEGREEDMVDRILGELDGLVVEEIMIRGYECPDFGLSEKEERRIHRP
ncbi:unnamed protein product [Vicia faba]|uniref:Uncharacterized protein n=1 Tax=Vicia faba TaxID=3906 RepID=A0AAV1A430_VICFA|nr:unnamed protein product [Vicia faba]